MGDNTLDSQDVQPTKPRFFDEAVEIDLDDELEASDDGEDGDDEPLDFDDEPDEPLKVPTEHEAAQD